MPESVASSFLSKTFGSGKSSTKEHKCTVQLMDDSETIACEFMKNDTGQVLLDTVCENLNLIEKDYFGLRFMDTAKHRYWLDPNKPILKQIKGNQPMVFRFRVKYYPADPSILKEEITRYQLFLQLRRDLLHGRLYCPQNDAARLGGYMIQSEVGDYSPDEQKPGYVSEFKLFLKQSAKLEEKIVEEHKQLKGMLPADADKEFLKRASTLDTYGFDPYSVKDLKLGQVYVGVNSQGFLVYQANRKVHYVKWDTLEKVDYIGKEISVFPKSEYFDDELAFPNEKESQKKKKGISRALKFQCPSGTFCKHLWKYILAQKAFFNSQKSSDVKPQTSKRRIPVIQRGSTFRFAGRVLQDIKESDVPEREEPSFIRHPVDRQPSRDERGFPWMNKYHTLPRNVKISEVKENAIGETKEAPELTIEPKRDSVLLETTAELSPTCDFNPGADFSEETNIMDQSLISNAPLTESYPSSDRGPFLDSMNVSSLPDVAPVCNSTPVKSAEMSEKPAPAGRHLSEEKKATTPETKEAPKRASSSACMKFVKHLLTGMLFGIILLCIVVVVFEVRNRQFKSYVHSVPGLETFRHLYYELGRHYVLASYQRYWGAAAAKSASKGAWFGAKAE